MAINVNSHTLQPQAFQFNHIGLSVANITALSHFYRKFMGFDNVIQNYTVHAPQLYQVVQLQNPKGVIIELVQNADSSRIQLPKDAMDGSKIQGYFHLALMVGDLDGVYEYITQSNSGCRGVSPPAPDEFRAGNRYAYVADPEGNLIELLSAYAT